MDAGARIEADFDAIVIGAGAAGGFAAALLTEAGLRVLTLDAGLPGGRPLLSYSGLLSRVVAPIAASPWAQRLPPVIEANALRALKLLGRVRQPVQTKCFAWPMAPASFVDDREFPYAVEPGTRFDWFRAHQVGGRMTIPGHGRQYYRLSEADFHPKDGLSPAWPFAPDALDAWYSLAESRLDLTGRYDGSPFAPDSDLKAVLELNPAEADLAARLRATWTSMTPILCRTAPPYDGVSAAQATGRLTLRRGAVAQRIEVDGGGHVAGVSWFDRLDRKPRDARAPLVFLCASALESTRLLLLSRSARSPDGLGGASGALGRHLMDHIVVSAQGVGRRLPEGAPETPGGRCIYVPRLALDGPERLSERGCGAQIYRWSDGSGGSRFNVVTFAEMAPRADNRVTLHPTRTDRFGAPILSIACRPSDDEMARAKAQIAAARAIADVCEVRLHAVDDHPAPPGTAIHECGAARMGADPKGSVLDPDNQCWDAKGLYVTDAAAFPSQGVQNPTLTILALTARACAHALRARGVTSPAWLSPLAPRGAPATQQAAPAAGSPGQTGTPA